MTFNDKVAQAGEDLLSLFDFKTFGKRHDSIYVFNRQKGAYGLGRWQIGSYIVRAYPHLDSNRFVNAVEKYIMDRTLARMGDYEEVTGEVMDRLHLQMSYLLYRKREIQK